MTTVENARSALAEDIRELAERAGREILAIYRSDDPQVRQKDDRSPVTEADVRAEQVILAGLADLTPDVPVVAEESVAAGRVPEEFGDRFWLVDPLDGTKEFLSHNGEFTVNIALVEHGDPVLGVVHTPAVGTSHVGVVGHGGYVRDTGTGNEQRSLAVEAPPAAGKRVLVSRSHLDPETENWLETLTVSERVQAGSSLKFCRIAEGAADAYPRFGRTMWWDTAAGHAVLLSAGGSVHTVTGGPLRYLRGERPELDNPGFIAYGREG